MVVPALDDCLVEVPVLDATGLPERVMKVFHPLGLLLLSERILLII